MTRLEQQDIKIVAEQQYDYLIEKLSCKLKMIKVFQRQCMLYWI